MLGFSKFKLANLKFHSILCSYLNLGKKVKLKKHVNEIK